MKQHAKRLLDYKFLFRQFVANQDKGGYNNPRRLRRVNRKRSLFSDIRKRSEHYISEQAMKALYSFK